VGAGGRPHTPPVSENHAVTPAVSGDFPVARLGRGVLAHVRTVGRSALFMGRALASAPRRPWRGDRIMEELHFVGVRSTAVVVLTGAFTGMVLALQGYRSLRGFGSEALLGSAVALALVRELGPVLSALMVAARAGSAITAELGIMRVTEQIDALEVMAVDPLKYLVEPRLVAAVLVLPLLTSLFDVVGIWGGYVVGVRFLGLPAGSYFSAMKDSVEMADVTGGLLKAAGFGLIVAGVCTWKGYFASQGARGVSRATTEAVVLSAVLVLVSDYFLTSALF
jgi:phospholipid/cholesterol/gamma-HCH transport system permease protein